MEGGWADDSAGNEFVGLRAIIEIVSSIARLAASLIDGVPLDDDGTMPDFSACTTHGSIPLVLRGKFGKQIGFVIDYLKNKVDLSAESVAILHPLGGGWFSETRQRLAGAGLPFVEISRQSEWPQGDENIALSTLHSAKGLEFDHVIMIGLNAEVMTHGDEEDDDQLLTLRKLLAMGIGRARLSVILGYKPGEESHLVDYLDEDSYKAMFDHCKDHCAQRNRLKVVHFTTHTGLLGTLHARAVKSRQRLPSEMDLELIYKPNAFYRKDAEWLGLR